MNSARTESERRRFLQTVASGTTLALAGCAMTVGGTRDSDKAGAKEEVSAGEDLMREHGVLERILLIYEEYARRIDPSAPIPVAVVTQSADMTAHAEPPADVITRSAKTVRRFIEDYHERLEEDYVFPRFESAVREGELVATLRAQHQRGRALTDQIVALGTRPDERAKLAQALRSFSRMYRPHAAREDTVLFPALHDLVGAAAYRELGERFEERERALFGEHGFVDIVREVTSLEQALGIHDLAQFTPT